jgi:hypothetical protein
VTGRTDPFRSLTDRTPWRPIVWDTKPPQGAGDGSVDVLLAEWNPFELAAGYYDIRLWRPTAAI